nr:hypothetical protein [Saprospiraceae bacterium]
MIIQKFGGTSVGSPERMEQVADLISDGNPKVVVLSAVAGTTNKLVSIGQALTSGNLESAKQQLSQLINEYHPFVDELLPHRTYNEQGKQVISTQFGIIADLFDADQPGEKEEKIILAQGELISTQLFTLYMNAIGRSCTLLPALEFMSRMLCAPDWWPSAPLSLRARKGLPNWLHGKQILLR